MISGTSFHFLPLGDLGACNNLRQTVLYCYIYDMIRMYTCPGENVEKAHNKKLHIPKYFLHNNNNNNNICLFVDII